jgi:hypothetical protein
VFRDADAVSSFLLVLPSRQFESARRKQVIVTPPEAYKFTSEAQCKRSKCFLVGKYCSIGKIVYPTQLYQHVINHFAGPTGIYKRTGERRESSDAKVQGVTPDPTAIQWLLLKAVDSLSTPDNKITFIQRICTEGGLAPTTGADAAHLGQLDSIPYRASYLFYVKE